MSCIYTPQPVEMVKGRWHKVAHYIIKYEKTEGDRIHFSILYDTKTNGYIFSSWMDIRYLKPGLSNPLTDEIQSLLTKYCTETLGIKAGVTVERSDEMCKTNRCVFGKQIKIMSSVVTYDSVNDCLHMGGNIIYIAGQFAKVVEDVVTVDGKEVEVRNGFVHIGQTRFNSLLIESLFAALTCSDPLTAEKCVKLLEKMNNNKK